MNACVPLCIFRCVCVHSYVYVRSLVLVHLCACMCSPECLYAHVCAWTAPSVRPTPGWTPPAWLANALACTAWQSSPCSGIKEMGGHWLFGTRLGFKWHSREKFQPLILATPDLHCIKCFLYFHNFYIYVSFSILYSWVIHEKQIERAIHNINNSTLYQSRNTRLGLEGAHLVSEEMTSSQWCQGAWGGDSSVVTWQGSTGHSPPPHPEVSVNSPLGALLRLSPQCFLRTSNILPFKECRKDIACQSKI